MIVKRIFENRVPPCGCDSENEGCTECSDYIPEEIVITTECDRIVVNKDSNTNKEKHLLYKDERLVDEFVVGDYDISVYIMENGVTVDTIRCAKN